MRPPHNAESTPQDPADEATGRHRRAEPFTGRHRRHEPRTGSRRTRGSAAAVLLLIIGAAPASIAETPAPRTSFDPTDLLAAREAALEATSRSQPRVAEQPPAPVPRGAVPSLQPEPEPEPEPAPEPEPVQAPAPIGGLDQQQMDHATTIVRVGQELGLPEQAYVVALATALQESHLRVYASPVVPESFNYPYDTVGADHDSVGIFQQRPSMGWCSVADCMDPATSARIFYQALMQVPGWDGLPVTVAAQTVQVSAFPDYYADDEPLARELVAAILG